MLFYKVIKTKHNGKECRDFKLNRPSGTVDYLFLHFKTPVIFNLDKKTYKLPTGTCILLSPGTAHEFYPDDCELVHDWMHFLPSDEDEFLKLNLKLNTFFTPTDTKFITVSVKKCEYELIYKEEFYKEFVSCTVEEMFIKLVRNLKERSSSYYSPELKELRFELYRNPKKYISVSDMANVVGLSRSRFTVVYTNFFGASPKQDIINARISHAQYLLSVGTVSIAEISESCGYQNVYHFIRQFRMITGTTPGAYKKGLL